MTLKISPDFLKSCDFEMALKVMDKFVENVLIGSDKHQKMKLVERFKTYQAFYELLTMKEKIIFQNQSNTTIDVPDEIWLKIMRYLDYKDVFENVSLVNKHFHNLTHDSSVIRSIDLFKTNDETKLHQKMEVLKRSRNITHIAVYDWDQYMKIQLEQVLECNPKLRFLEFDPKSIKTYNRNENRHLLRKDARIILKKFANQIEILRFDYMAHALLEKEEYLGLTNMCNLKCFRIKDLYYDFLSSEEVLIPLGLNCKKLECIEFQNLQEFEFVVRAFDKFFQERQNTLKRLNMCHYELLNENIFQNLPLCQKMEELLLMGCFMSYESFYSILKLSSLKTIKIQDIPSELLEIASWPSLERLWIGIEEPFWEIDQETKFTDNCIKSLLSNSLRLKSIHFYDSDQCDISNEFLFEMCKERNIFVSFGPVPTFRYPKRQREYSGFKADIMKSPRQLEIEIYFCEQDIEVYYKYQNMKNEFSKWLNQDSPWFNCNALPFFESTAIN